MPPSADVTGGPGPYPEALIPPPVARPPQFAFAPMILALPLVFISFFTSLVLVLALDVTGLLLLIGPAATHVGAIVLGAREPLIAPLLVSHPRRPLPRRIPRYLRTTAPPDTRKLLVP